MATTVEKVTLVMREDEHNKVWSYEILQEADGTHTVRCAWGRLGTKGQQKDFQCGSLYSAEDLAREKRGEKINKGYQEILADELELLTVRSQIVGPKMKPEKLEFITPIEAYDLGQSRWQIVEKKRLADPNLKLSVWCAVRAENEIYNIIVGADDVFLCDVCGVNKQWSRSLSNPHASFQSTPEELLTSNPRRLEDLQNKVAKKLLERIPPIVATLF